jgi:hypothetical protein
MFCMRGSAMSGRMTAWTATPRAEAHGQGLEHGVVIDEGAALLQGGLHGPQGFVAFEAHGQVRLAGGNHGAVGGLSEPYLGHDDAAALGQAVGVDGLGRVAGVVGRAQDDFAQQADALPADAAKVYVEDVHVMLLNG